MTSALFWYSTLSPLKAAPFRVAVKRTEASTPVAGAPGAPRLVTLSAGAGPAAGPAATGASAPTSSAVNGRTVVTAATTPAAVERLSSMATVSVGGVAPLRGA